MHDAGRDFFADVFYANSDMLHVSIKSVPVEAAHFISVIERYLDPLRRAFIIIKKNDASTATDTEALQMAVKAVHG